jgi:hypothetical protein
MEPAAEFLTPPTSFISVSLTTEVRALHRVVSQRLVSFPLVRGEVSLCHQWYSLLQARKN